MSIVLFFLLACSSQKGGAPKEAAQKIQVTSQTIQLGGPPPPVEKTAPQEKLSPEEVRITPMPAQETQAVPFQPTIVKTGLGVELIMDASGSMNGLLGTETKLNTAISLIKELVSQWKNIADPHILLGLRVFGSESPLETGNCEDSKLLSPIAPIEPSLQKNLEGLKALGKSPIAFALKKASEDLTPINEDRVIILLTDGRDNCNQDPCAQAKELYEGPLKIITHVVGFDVTQEDEEPLKCIAKASHGVYLLARTKEELASALDEALGSTIPYNLRLKTLVGGTPIPTTITVYKALTQEILKKEEGHGIELLRLPPSSYDILVEYSQSIETKRPSKILKGVALTETGKVEQEIRFDLASVTLSARDAKGEPTKTHYTFLKAGTDNKIAEYENGGEETTLFIAPGTYDLVAQSKSPDRPPMILTEPNVSVTQEQGAIKQFAFQTGTLILKGQNSKKEPVSLKYKITKSDNPEAVMKEGEVDPNGGKMELPPGTYDIYVEGQDPALTVQPRGFLKNIAVEGGSILEKTALLVVGALNLQAKIGEEKRPSCQFKILDNTDKKEVATLKAEDGKASLALSPGKYDIHAFLASPIYTEPPETEVEGISIEEGKTLDQTLTFVLGTLRLLGRNAKEQRLTTSFTVYKGGTEEAIAQTGANSGWFEFNLSAGNYDVKGIQEDATTEPKPTVWLRDITLEANNVYSHEAVFTNAKLKLIGRGTNNEIVAINFKLYEYGHDRPLINGTTGKDWQTFDLIPGQYYIEASYPDKESAQTLKKWITLKVGENEFVEKELRF